MRADEMGMRCPICGSGRIRVTETRVVTSGVRRRRACNQPGCDGRFSTVELVVPTRADCDDLMIVKRTDIELLRESMEQFFSGGRLWRVYRGELE